MYQVFWFSAAVPRRGEKEKKGKKRKRFGRKKERGKRKRSRRLLGYCLPLFPRGLAGVDGEKKKGERELGYEGEGGKGGKREIPPSFFCDGIIVSRRKKKRRLQGEKKKRGSGASSVLVS